MTSSIKIEFTYWYIQNLKSLTIQYRLNTCIMRTLIMYN